jgi:hypothetical protein
MHIQLQIVSKLLLFVNFRGSNSAEGGTYQLADMYRRGPNTLADMDRGVHIRGESKSAVTPDEIWDRSEIRPFSPPVYTRICPVRGSQIRQSGSVVLVCLHGRISDRAEFQTGPKFVRYRV